MTGAMIPMPVEDPRAMAWFDTNDLGNAKRLDKLAKGLLLWVEEVGWVGYDGRRWSSRDGERMAIRLAHDVAHHIDAEALALESVVDRYDDGKTEWIPEEEFGKALPIGVVKDRAVALRKHAVKSGNASMTAGMLSQAKTPLSARLEDFDRDPLAFNALNGTLRFHFVEGGGWERRFAPHDPTDRIMQIANVVYDPEAKCPDWEARMVLVQPAADQRELLQCWYGYCLTALTSEQKWVTFQGRGGDGKSLTDDTISKLFGDYYRHAQVETFLQSGTQKSGSEHSSDLARLQGDIRLVICDEPPARSTWNGGRLKQVTGSTITCRPMNKTEIEYKARWKLIVEVNQLPAVPSDDDGFWRRVVPIPWSYQFDKGGAASQPFEELVAHFVDDEGSGILNWMIAGTLKWLETRRLPISTTATEFSLQYRASASPMGEWYMDCCDTSDPTAMTPSGELHASFKVYCEGAEIDPIPTPAKLGRWLRDKQHGEKKDRVGKRHRMGIRLKTIEERGRDAAPAPAAPPSAAAPAQSDGGVVGRAEPSTFSGGSARDELPD